VVKRHGSSTKEPLQRLSTYTQLLLFLYDAAFIKQQCALFLNCCVPMKYFNTLFDIFLYEGIFIFFFGAVLYLLDDKHGDILLTIAFISGIVAAILGFTGKAFHLFKHKNDFEER
jgi:hypothetical protein